MGPKTPPRRRPAPDVLPDSLPRKDADVLPDDRRPSRDDTEMTPDSLPRREPDIPASG